MRWISLYDEEENGEEVEDEPDEDELRGLFKNSAPTSIPSIRKNRQSIKIRNLFLRLFLFSSLSDLRGFFFRSNKTVFSLSIFIN